MVTLYFTTFIIIILILTQNQKTNNINKLNYVFLQQLSMLMVLIGAALSSVLLNSKWLRTNISHNMGSYEERILAAYQWSLLGPLHSNIQLTGFLY